LPETGYDSAAIFGFYNFSSIFKLTKVVGQLFMLRVIERWSAGRVGHLQMLSWTAFVNFFKQKLIAFASACVCAAG
jgi:hypothetical protein